MICENCQGDCDWTEKYCKACAPKMSYRRDPRTALRFDAIRCPICDIPLNTITAGHYRTHGFTSAESFKEATGCVSLTAPSLLEELAQYTREHSVTKGRLRTPEERAKMSLHRRGKGLGVAGKYVRTSEIRDKISKGVAQEQLDNPRGYCFRGEFVQTDKAGLVWVRSSWEKRVLRVLDHYALIESVQVEPFYIKYPFEGSTHRYIPDLLITFMGGIKELWEIKPQVMTKTPKNLAKIKALKEFAESKQYHWRVITEKEMCRMEQKTQEIWQQLGNPAITSDCIEY